MEKLYLQRKIYIKKKEEKSRQEYCKDRVVI
jgi:hypothetical protein